MNGLVHRSDLVMPTRRARPPILPYAHMFLELIISLIYIKKMPHLSLKLVALSLKTYGAALVHIIIELNVN
jgi:hypothetical protein